MTRNLVLILGDQLTLDNPALEDFDSTQDQILMVEAPAEATQVWSHKARIAVFLSAMRHFALALNAQQFPLIYLQLGTHAFPTLKQVWLHYIEVLQPQKVIICEPGEYRLEQDLIALAKETHTTLAMRDDTHFMCSRADFKRWAGTNKTLRMEFFYRTMRKQYQVLMQGDAPEGGAWNYDAENRKAFGKAGPQGLPAAPEIVIDEISQQVMADIAQHFPDHPGSLANFIWPVTRAQALVFLQNFVANKLAAFGDHQDAMWQFQNGSQSAYLWHSLLSSSLNLKLLNPREVIAAVLQAYQLQQLSLPSVEGFIRQVLGWREFIRGVYWLDMPGMAHSNHYQHARKLPAWYWTANTHMNCQRQAIQQTLDYGYAHHIQRLMVTGMFGVLAEINPREVEAWYLAAYVDAIEWVELPNVAGMALYANGGRFTSKPYVASGAYIKRMSNYCASCRYKPDVKTGPDACPVTTLYWNFLLKHYDVFAKNPRTALMAKNAERFSADEQALIRESAEKVLNNLDHI
jgi:deoxyribodipyrimidine photolyase-related protein